MKIAICGAHSQGKTTIVEALRNDPDFKDFEFHVNLTRDLKARGIPINEQGTAYTQLCVMLEHYRRAKLEGDHVFDRCAVDGLIYSSVILGDSIENGPEMDIIHNIFCTIFNDYDYVFYIKPELPLVDDGFRTVNQEFFGKIRDKFEEFVGVYYDLTSNPGETRTMFTISGSVEDRIKQIKNTIWKK